MTKRKIIYAVLVLLTLGLAACQQEDDFAPQGGEEQELRIATRSTATEGTTEAFTRDFNLDLWSNDNPNKYERHGMHFDGTSWNVVKTNKLYDNTVAFATTGKGNNMDLDAVKNQYTLCLFDSQGTSSNVDDFDIMYAYNPNVDVKTPLDLEFNHLFTKITVNIEYGSEFIRSPKMERVLFACELLKPKVIIKGIETGNLQFDYAQDWGILSTFIDYGDEEEITDDKMEVIVGIGTLPPGHEFIHLYDRLDTSEPWKKALVPEGGFTFEAGKHYTFKLKLGRDIVTLTPVGTGTDFPGGWSNETEEELK